MFILSKSTTLAFQEVPLSLMDLPDLALERIATHLLAPDLANCMACCTTLNTLLRPRLTAMVRARSLGRKWVLRACGRALYADVASRYKAGIGRFEYSGPITNWADCCALGRFLAENAERQFRFCEGEKTFKGTRRNRYLNLPCFFYVCNLANSRGFDQVLGVLRQAWDRAVLREQRARPGWDHVQCLFQDMMACCQIYDSAGFQLTAPLGVAMPLEGILVAFRQSLDASGLCRPQPGFIGLVTDLEKVVWDLSKPEVLSAISLVSFLESLFHPAYQTFGIQAAIPIDTIMERFKYTLDLNFK